MVHRKLSRTASHRASLLRNLVTSLIEHESITTTHAKAKEAQTFAERLITRARKQNVDAQDLSNYIYKPSETLPRLEHLASRYKDRTGGYTRILRLENRLGDNAPQAILEFVAGPRDMRAAMTARVVARYEAQGEELDPITAKNVEKLVKLPNGEAEFRTLVDEMKAAFYTEDKLSQLPPLLVPKQRQHAPIEFVE